MPLDSGIVGARGAPLTQSVDARWTMAYAACLGHDEPRFLDTRARPDVLAHPLFPVCFEWPLFLDPKHLPTPESLQSEERLRGVHASHDLVLHRPLRAGIGVTTTARVVQVAERRSGAYQLTRLESVDDDGAPLCTTWYGTLFRGVDVRGGDRAIDEALAPPVPEALPHEEREIALPVATHAAHVYTECARIWNPIHTDAAVAAAAGLPAILLHGTATLAMAVTALLRDGLEAERVERIGGRFRDMVFMPSTCALRRSPLSSGSLAFEVRNEEGRPAVGDGFVTMRPGAAGV